MFFCQIKLSGPSSINPPEPLSSGALRVALHLSWGLDTALDLAASCGPSGPLRDGLKFRQLRRLFKSLLCVIWDMSDGQEVLVDDALILLDGRGHRFRAVFQPAANQGLQVGAELSAVCPDLMDQLNGLRTGDTQGDGRPIDVFSIGPTDMPAVLEVLRVDPVVGLFRLLRRRSRTLTNRITPGFGEASAAGCFLGGSGNWRPTDIVPISGISFITSAASR